MWQAEGLKGWAVGVQMDGGKVQNVELSTHKVKLTPKEFAVSACMPHAGREGYLGMCL